MTLYTFEHATPETLADHMHFQKTQSPDDLRARLADGRTRYEQLCQMHSGRGIEATWGQGTVPFVFPGIRPGLEFAGLEALAHHLAQTASGKRVILTEGLAPVDAEPWLAAGWVLDKHALMAQTDLTARTWTLDPRVQERPVLELLAPDLLDLYAELAKVGKIGDRSETNPATAFKDAFQNEENRLFVLVEDGMGHGGRRC